MNFVNYVFIVAWYHIIQLLSLIGWAGMILSLLMMYKHFHIIDKYNLRRQQAIALLCIMSGLYLISYLPMGCTCTQRWIKSFWKVGTGNIFWIEIWGPTKTPCEFKKRILVQMNRIKNSNGHKINRSPLDDFAEIGYTWEIV